MISMAIAMIVFSIIIDSQQISPTVYPELQLSVTVSFSVFFLLGLFGIWTSYSRGTIHH